jgi:hypothetical protein
MCHQTPKQRDGSLGEQVMECYSFALNINRSHYEISKGKQLYTLSVSAVTRLEGE